MFSLDDLSVLVVTQRREPGMSFPVTVGNSS